MTLQELSVEYRAHARALDFRICQLQAYWTGRRTRRNAVCWQSGSECCLPCFVRPGNWQCLPSATMRGGTAEMPNTRYRRGKLYAADMALYSMQMPPTTARRSAVSSETSSGRSRRMSTERPAARRC